MRLLTSILILLLLGPSLAFAWGAKGHQAVGAIADRLLTAKAKSKVASLIGISLEQAGPWLDCVKDVKGWKGALTYVEEPAYADGCAIFWNDTSKDAMKSFAGNNWDNCPTGGDGYPCHNQYHFADVDILPSHPIYVNDLPGTTDYDVVHAMNAAIAILRGKAAPTPFKTQMTEPEALLVLAHLVGDIHQPLHTGSIYLDADGDQIAATSGEEETDPGFTRGGNWLFLDTKNLHGIWDYVSDTTVANAKKIAKKTSYPTSGDIANWPAIWATDTMVVAKIQLESLEVKHEFSDRRWPVKGTLGTYATAIAPTQAEQMARAGRHFADLLNTIWP